MNKDTYDNWLPEAKKDTANFSVDSTCYYDENINAVFDKLESNIRYICSEYDKLITSATTATNMITVSDYRNVSQEVSTLDNDVLIFKVEKDSDDTAYLPNIKNTGSYMMSTIMHPMPHI